ncbi:MAG: tetratricopeptide repeat protein, partial [Chloroflexi bacterium]|nr:tetratricopeptide repeat protein [Chloroflexota bacterium]
AGVKDFAPLLNPPAPTPRVEDAEELFRREVRATLAGLSAHWSVAEEERRAQLKRRPGSARAQAGLAGALLGLGKREEALAAFAESARLDPGRARTYYSWGTALDQAGQLDEAEGRLRRAAELEPQDPEILIGYAGVLQKQKRLEDANAVIARAYAAAPTHPLARGLHGAALVDGGKKEEGIALLRDAVAWSHDTPFSRTLRTTLVDALKKAARWDEAETELRDILAANDDDPLSHYYLATFLNERGKRDDARRHAQRCLDLKPSSAVEAAARALLDRLAP